MGIKNKGCVLACWVHTSMWVCIIGLGAHKRVGSYTDKGKGPSR